MCIAPKDCDRSGAIKETSAGVGGAGLGSDGEKDEKTYTAALVLGVVVTVPGVLLVVEGVNRHTAPTPNAPRTAAAPQLQLVVGPQFLGFRATF